MSVWQENLKRLLRQKEVLIIHGNVRDSAYIKKDGNLIPGLTDLLRETGRELGYQRIVSRGVFFDHEGKGHSPMWSLERIESLQEGSESQVRTIGSENREVTLLTRWLQNDVKDVNMKTLFVINYIDKLTPFNKGGSYAKDIALLVTLIQKIIENIADNNRLIMVALRDSMVPLEYYTNSPSVAVMEIQKPDKEERKIYFSRHLSPTKMPEEQIDFLANITDALYARDLENILGDVMQEKSKIPELSYTILRKIVNRYRIGTDEDPWSKLPISGPPKGLIDSADGWFREKVIGQDHAIHEVVKAIKKARAGVVGLATGQASKPKAAFFFAGPTGTGKTFLAKKLAEYLFDTEEAFVRLDMSELKEEHTVSKLIGAPPGYIGYEEGGQLTNAVRERPFSVILFDEMDKAHPRIMDIFLQILDDGRVTDSRGQTVFFTESIIVFTSNIGARTINSNKQAIGERENLDRIIAKTEDLAERSGLVREHFIRAVQEFFLYEISRPELLNRIGSHIIGFNYIDDPEAKKKLVESKLKDISKNFRDKFANLGHRLNFKEGVVPYFLEKHKQSIEKYGGRGLVNAIDDEIGHHLADQVLLAEKHAKSAVTFEIHMNEGGELKCLRA